MKIIIQGEIGEGKSALSSVVAKACYQAGYNVQPTKDGVTQRTMKDHIEMVSKLEVCQHRYPDDQKVRVVEIEVDSV